MTVSNWKNKRNWKAKRGRNKRKKRNRKDLRRRNKIRLCRGRPRKQPKRKKKSSNYNSRPKRRQESRSKNWKAGLTSPNSSNLRMRKRTKRWALLIHKWTWLKKPPTNSNLTQCKLKPSKNKKKVLLGLETSNRNVTISIKKVSLKLTERKAIRKEFVSIFQLWRIWILISGTNSQFR